MSKEYKHRLEAGAARRDHDFRVANDRGYTTGRQSAPGRWKTIGTGGGWPGDQVVLGY